MSNIAVNTNKRMKMSQDNTNKDSNILISNNNNSIDDNNTKQANSNNNYIAYASNHSL